MKIAADLLVLIVAFQHIIFLILEMFLWQTPLGMKIFHMNKEKAAITSILAKNQGLYNGFLAAGLFWSFFIPDTYFQYQIRIFFLLCIIFAGIFGAMTAKFTILYYQALPALLALIAVILVSISF